MNPKFVLLTGVILLSSLFVVGLNSYDVFASTAGGGQHPSVDVIINYPNESSNKFTTNLNPYPLDICFLTITTSTLNASVNRSTDLTTAILTATGNDPTDKCITLSIPLDQGRNTFKIQAAGTNPIDGKTGTDRDRITITLT